MNRYTVVSSPAVENQLGELILPHWGTPLGAQFVEAANRLDVVLATQPRAAGGELRKNVFLIVIRPLAAEYSVSDDDRLVHVLRYFQPTDVID